MARQPARDSSGNTEEEQKPDEEAGAPADINESRRNTDGNTNRNPAPGGGDTPTQKVPDDINQGRRDQSTSSAESSSRQTTASAPTDINQGRRNTQPQDSGGTPTSGSQQPPASDATTSEQGIETGVQGSNSGADSRVSAFTDQAQELEQRVIEENRNVDDESDVRIQQENGELRATLTESGRSEILAARRQRAERRRDAQTGRTAARISSFETGIRREFADENPGVEASDVTVTGTEGGNPQIALNQDAQAALAGLTPTSSRGGRRQIQETSLENRAAAQRGDALTPGEVDASVTDDGVSVSINEIAPVVAGQEGGRRQMQSEAIQERTADRVSGVNPEDINPNLTESGANPELTERAQEQQVRERIVTERDDIQEGDIRVDVTEGGEVNVEATEQGQRRQLRQQAEAEYPNAEDIDIVEDNGELVAEIEQENDVERLARFGDNFIDDPVGSLTEGSTDIATDLATDTDEFIEGRARGLRNPDESLDWAISGTEQNTIDPVASAIDTFASDPQGAIEGGIDDTAGGIVELAEGGADFSGGLARGAVNAGSAAFDDVSSRADSGLAAAAVPVALGEPTPVGESVLVGGVALGTAAAGTFYAGREAGRAFDQGFETTLTASTGGAGISNQDVNELPAPSERQDFQQTELPVNEDTGRVEQEIEVDEEIRIGQSEVDAPESTDLGQNELQTPESPPDTGMDVSDGEVGISLTPQSAIGELDEPESEEEALQQIEEVLEDPEEFSQRERRELARQAYEQTIFEQQRRFGEIERERVPEFRDEELSSGEAAQDIGSGIAGEAQQSEVDDDVELIGGSTEGIQREETLPVQDNFDQFMEEQRQRLERAQQRGVRETRREDGEEEDLDVQSVTDPSVTTRSQQLRERAESGVGLTTPLLFVGNQDDDLASQRDNVERDTDTTPLERIGEDADAENLGEEQLDQAAVNTPTFTEPVNDTQTSELTEERVEEVAETAQPEEVRTPELTGNPNLTNNPTTNRTVRTPRTPGSPGRPPSNPPGLPLIPELNRETEQIARTETDENDLRYIYSLGDPLAVSGRTATDEDGNIQIPGFDEE